MITFIRCVSNTTDSACKEVIEHTLPMIESFCHKLYIGLAPLSVYTALQVTQIVIYLSTNTMHSAIKPLQPDILDSFCILLMAICREGKCTRPEGANLDML